MIFVVIIFIYIVENLNIYLVEWIIDIKMNKVVILILIIKIN